MFVPAYFFRDKVCIVAIIGGSHHPFVIMKAGMAKWAHILVPFLMLLTVFNLFYLFADMKKRES